MTRSSSPNGAIEFSYEFPRASTSALPVPTPRRPRSPQSHTLRRPSPTRHYQSDIDDDGADDDDESFGYSHFRPTGNQWAQAPQPSYAFPSSFDSEMSALSSVTSQSHAPKKIRKAHHHARASFDEPPSPSYSYDIFDEASSYSDSDVEDDDEAIPEPTTPSSSPCTSLRREWVALSLRVQFGVFRAKRRIRNMHTIARVTSL